MASARCAGREFPFGLPFVAYEDSIVFRDLSTLFVSLGSGEGRLCFAIDFATGEVTGNTTIDLVVTGGTRRFAGATGELRFDADVVNNSFFEYVTLEGTLEGRLRRGGRAGDDDD